MKFKALVIDDDQIELLSALIARCCGMLDREIDEHEAFEIAVDFLNETPLDVSSMDTLIRMIQTTRYSPDKDLLN